MLMRRDSTRLPQRQACWWGHRPEAQRRRDAEALERQSAADNGPIELHQRWAACDMGRVRTMAAHYAEQCAPLLTRYAAWAGEQPPLEPHKVSAQQVKMAQGFADAQALKAYAAARSHELAVQQFNDSSQQGKQPVWDGPLAEPPQSQGGAGPAAGQGPSEVQ